MSAAFREAYPRRPAAAAGRRRPALRRGDGRRARRRPGLRPRHHARRGRQLPRPPDRPTARGRRPDGPHPRRGRHPRRPPPLRARTPTPTTPATSSTAPTASACSATSPPRCASAPTATRGCSRRTPTCSSARRSAPATSLEISCEIDPGRHAARAASTSPCTSWRAARRPPSRPGAAAVLDRAAAGHHGDRHRRRPGLTPHCRAPACPARHAVERRRFSARFVPTGRPPLTCAFARSRRSARRLTATRGHDQSIALVRPCRSWPADRRPSGRVGGWGATIPPTLFAEVGPAPRGRTRKGPRLPRQLPALGSQSVSGWSEGSGDPSVRSAARPGYLCHRAPPDRCSPSSPASCWPWPSSRSGASCLIPLAVAGFVLVTPRPARRAGPGSRASPSASASATSCCSGCGSSASTPGWRSSALEAVVLRRCSAPVAAVLLAAARVAAVVACRLGGDRGGPLQLAVQRHALGPAGLRHRRHPVGRRPCPYVGSSGRQPAARAARRLPGLAWSSPPAGARVVAGRGGGWRAGRRAGCPALAPYDVRRRRAADRRGRPGRRARRRRRHPARPPPGDPQPRRRHGRGSPTRSPPGDAAAPGLRALAGELHRRRPVRRRRRSTPASREASRRGRRADPGRRRWSTPGPSTCSTRASSGSPDTGAGDRYTKRHPVPFGEYIPWRSVFRGNFGQLALIPRDMLSGTRDRAAARSPAPLVADAICFDVAYDDGIHAQLRERRRAARRADPQRDVHPHQPDRAAVRDHPAAGPRDRPLRPGRGHQRRLRRDRARRHRGRPGRRRAPRPCSLEEVGAVARR